VKLKPALTPTIIGPSSGGSVSLRPVFGTGPAGAAGADGADGADGLPGVNAVANDTATATYITTPGSDTNTALLASFVGRAASDTAHGIHFGADPTVDPFITIGNVNNSGGWPGDGSPPGTPGALAVYRTFGTNDGLNAPIQKSTQAIFIVAPYYGPTADDSAEAGSSSVIVKNTGTPYTQSEQTIAWESSASVEQNVTATGLVTAMAGRVNVGGTASQAISVRASAQTDPAVASTGTIDTYYAFAQLATPQYGTVTTKWGVYVVDKAHSELGLSIGDGSWTGQATLQRDGTGSTAALLLLKGPDSAPGLTNLVLRQGTGQTRSLMEVQNAAGDVRFQFGATGVARFAGVVTNWTDGSSNVRMVMDHATGLEFKEARDIIVGTTTGTKIGTLATQKLAFFGATPIVRPANTKTSRQALEDLGLLTTGGDLATDLGYGFASNYVGIPVSSATTWASSNQAAYYRVYGAGTFTKIAVHVTTSSGNVSFAVYSRSGSGRSAVPGTRLVTTGAIACPAIGYQEVSLGGSVTVAPGDFIAMSCDNTTAAFQIVGGSITDMAKGMAYQQATAHPAPSTPASLTASFSRAPLLTLIP
jgi:hypothetical protein